MSEIAPEIHLSLAALQTEVTNLKLDLTEKIGKLETEVRVVKHDYDNLKGVINGLSTKFEKMEEKIGSKMDGLLDKITGLDVSQAKGFGFFAGVGAVFTVSVTVILAIVKVLFK
jgi:hypothetical protein